MKDSVSPFNYLGPCNPDMFVGRKNLIQEILYGQQNGFAIAAGRRIGKSSLLFKIHSIALNSDTYFPLYKDCSNYNHFNMLVSDVKRELLPNMASDYLSNISDILRQYKILNNRKVLLLLDEMDVLVKEAKNTNNDTISFFNSLRLSFNTGDVRIVLAGVSHVFEMINDYSHPLCNMCEGMKLGMLDESDVKSLITIPFMKAGIELESSEEIVNKIYAITSGHPSFVQFIGKQLFHNRNQTNIITTNNLKSVIDEEDTISFTLDIFLMNTTPLERLICLLTLDCEYFDIDTIIKKLKINAVGLLNFDRKIYNGLSRLAINGIIVRDKNKYKLLNPIMKKLIQEYYFSDEILTNLIIEVRDEKSDSSGKIIRSIEFPPEYHHAGVSILNYFGTVLRKKDPKLKAKIRIEQDDNKVTMIIDPIEGKKEVIEQTLYEYGLVIHGEILPEQFTDDKFLILELKNELRLEKARIESQKELLQYQNSHIKQLFSLIGQAFINQTNINIDSSQYIESHISQNIQFIQQIFSSIQIELDELKEFFKEQPDITEEITTIQNDLKLIEHKPQSEIKKSFVISRLKKLLENLEKYEIKFGKIIKNVQNFIDISQKLASHYNKVAEWLGLPQVPKPFLKKKSG